MSNVLYIFVTIFYCPLLTAPVWYDIVFLCWYMQIIRIGDNEVMLEWYNTPFDGIPPSKYKISMKNETRNFNSWNDVYYPGDITKTRFMVRNLPMGIACQFRVAAFNNGGWGEFSDPTTSVIPGEQHEVLPDAFKWRRIRQGGVLALLDRLEMYPNYYAEYEVGLRMLFAMGQNGHGFKTVPITLRVAALALKALDTYHMDPEVATRCFNILGWCLRGNKFERKVRQLCLHTNIVKTVELYMKYFRKNPRVMGSICWLRGGMQKYLPPDPELDLTTLLPTPGQMEGHDEEEDDIIVMEEEEEDDDNEEGGKQTETKVETSPQKK
jgi:hypothetical protein